jgi:nicotinamidase-related amidase
MTSRRKLILCALWTEACMAFTALDALREGYEVYPVIDAIGGTSPLACELQRDWARQDTVAAIIEIVLTERLLKEQ